MEIFSNLALGLSVTLQPMNLAYCFVGVLLGTVIGVLPGIGPLATIALLLPITFGLPPEGSLIMLAGIYYGSQYGGSTTAILLKLPGEAASAVTTIDGHQMALKGRAGPALATAAIGSFFAGTVATLLIALAARPLTELAFNFGPAEYFSLMVVGLISSIALASGSVLKAVGMIVLGLILALTGTDIYTGARRFTFGSRELLDGLEFVAIAVGLFGISEVMRNLEHSNVVSGSIAKVGGSCRRGRISVGWWPRSCAAPPSARSSASSPAAGRSCRRSCPTTSRRTSRATRRSSATGRSKVSPRPRPPTTRARRLRSFRCCRWASRRTWSWR